MLITQLYFAFLSLAIISFYIIAAIYFPQLYIFGTYEDMYGEWVQFFFFLLTFIFALLNALNPTTKQYRWFFGLLAMAALYTCMEEISWGQRLIGFDTPDFFEEHSYQNEANLHNLLTGPVESWTKTALTYLIALGMFGYGVIFPIMLARNWHLAQWFDKWGCFAPPLGLMPAFVAAGIFELEFFSFNEAEVAELLVAMAMSFTAIYFWLTTHSRWQFKALSIFIAITLFVFITAFTTTELLLRNPAQKKAVTHRLANGYKKFADRYARYDHHQAVIDVLTLYGDLKPNNTVILRRIRKQYLLLDEYAKADEILDKAIAIALARYQENPESLSTLISLAKSYHQLQRPDKVYAYANQAYELALQIVENKALEKKERAYGHYWLAKACEQLNKQAEALKHFRRAYKLVPNYRRYQRAYYSKRKLMEKYYDEDWSTGLYTD